MSGYGHDESAPTPNGLFATHFVGVCGYFTDCSPRISWYEYGILGWYAKPKPLRELWEMPSSHSTLEDKKMKEKSFKMPLTSVYFFTIFLPLTIYMPFGRRFMLLDSRRPSNENTPCCAVFVLVSSVVSMPWVFSGVIVTQSVTGFWLSPYSEKYEYPFSLCFFQVLFWGSVILHPWNSGYSSHSQQILP